MNFKNNATYRFICRADKNRSLNVYGDSGSVPSAQTNVCLYASGASDTCQQWIYKESGGNKYFVCKKNPNLALDMYTGSTSGQTNVNAHVYAPSNTSYLAFEDTDSGYIKIRLSKYSNKYLTANQGDNGTNTGRTTHDKGNVYWYAGGLTDHSQEWKPVLVDEGSTPDPDPDPQPGKQVTVTNMPAGVYPNDTEYFHPQSGMKNGTWEQNGGAQIEKKMRAFYKKVYGTEPLSASNYLNNLYGAKVIGTEKYHLGVDINHGEGSRVTSAHSGTVIKAGRTKSNEVAIFDGSRTYYYLHFKTRYVKEGDTVIAGKTILGLEGKEGWASGFHLHLEIFDGKDTTGPKNPPTLNGSLSSIAPYNFI